MERTGGACLTGCDGIEGLFKSSEGSELDAKDRRMWLALFNGFSWSRSTMDSDRLVLNETRLNYAGIFSALVV